MRERRDRDNNLMVVISRWIGRRLDNYGDSVLECECVSAAAVPSTSLFRAVKRRATTRVTKYE